MLTHRRSSAKASSLSTILITPISTKKTKKNRMLKFRSQLQIKHDTDGFDKQGMRLLLATLNRIFDSLQTTYEGFQTSTVKAIYIFDLSAQGKHFLPVLMNFRLWSSILFKRNVLTRMLSIFPLYLTCNPNLYLCERICSFLFCRKMHTYKSWLQVIMKKTMMKFRFLTYPEAQLPLRYVPNLIKNELISFFFYLCTLHNKSMTLLVKCGCWLHVRVQTTDMIELWLPILT
ncbi:uncharacterized protein LOC105804042 isoform X1 [Gossypium raimondii]|uniref:uncharacterized protein LOC105804042 isoform X1 n=2 Tax=Gossypium raimondii TaxID=29730 RepID=UPI00227BDA18|nr:uncharacterized protein LOC105804042 isoform X1 [Gossypium raimondii]